MILPGSIRLSEQDPAFSGFSADDAIPAAFGLVNRHATCGSLGHFLDLGLTFLSFTPPGISPAVLDNLGQLLHVFGIVNIAVSEGSCFS